MDNLVECKGCLEQVRHYAKGRCQVCYERKYIKPKHKEKQDQYKRAWYDKNKDSEEYKERQKTNQRKYHSKPDYKWEKNIRRRFQTYLSPKRKLARHEPGLCYYEDGEKIETPINSKKPEQAMRELAIFKEEKKKHENKQGIH